MSKKKELKATITACEGTTKEDQEHVDKVVYKQLKENILKKLHEKVIYKKKWNDEYTEHVYTAEFIM